MKKLAIIFTLTVIMITMSGCREVHFSIDNPSGGNTASGEQIVGTMHVGSQTDDGSVSTLVIDPEQYFFPVNALPENANFNSFNRKIVNVSYLDSNGDLLGILYIRQYQSDRDDLYVTQMILQSPVPITSNLLQAGHYGKDYQPAAEDMLLGENARILNKQASIFLSERTVSYRFYKGNTMVMVDLCGTHPFVTEQNAYQLAQLIEQKLPAELPIADGIASPTLQYSPDLFSQYFKALDLVDCDKHQLVQTYREGNTGICFHADLVNVIKDFKVGIYSERYERVIYQQDYLYSPALGDWTSGLFHSIWGFGWNNLPQGDYRALFWVDDQLVASIPFAFAYGQ